LGGRLELASLFLGPEGKYASTIVEAISIAAMRLHERSGVYQLHVLSDMVQITSGPGGVNFQLTVLPARDFLAWVKKSGLAADLRNIPVLVCGLHTGQFGPTGGAYTARLQDTWQKAFQAMGSPESSFFTLCDTALAASH
jgi:hypothetical protein